MNKMIDVRNVGLNREFILYFFFYSFIALSLLAPIAADSYIINSADYINHISGTIQAKMALEEGQFPLRIAPFQLQGYRYPLFQFYSPTTYTLTGIIYKFLTPTNPLIALKIILWLGLCIGGLSIQRLAFWFTRSHNAALLAGVAYLLAPYYILVVSYFGDIPEALALGIVPAAIYYSLQLYLHRQHTTINLLKVGLIWYALITIHLITFFYTLIFSIIFFSIVTARNRNHWHNYLNVLKGYFFAILMAAWHLGPIILLGKLLIISKTFSDPTTFIKANTVISHLLFSSTLEFTTLWDIHPTIGWVMLLSFGVAIYASANNLRLKQNKRANFWLPFLLIMFSIIFILVWTPLNFWSWMPQMFRVGQYNWRLLDQSLWVGALIFAWAMIWIFDNKLDKRHIILGIIIIASLSNGWYHTKKNFGVPLKSYIKEPVSVFNSSAYVIDTETNPKIVNKIHGINLPFRNEKNELLKNAEYIIPPELLAYTKHPSIFIKGKIPDTIKPNSEIEFTLDNKLLKKLILKPGALLEHIPLNLHTRQGKNYSLKIQSSDDFKVPINQVYLEGFINPASLIDAETVLKHCKTTAMLECNFIVNPLIKLIELPIIYYPYLLNITLNGKKIPYENILFDGVLLAAIKPEPGAKNNIKIEFTGLPWANWTSLIAWLYWGWLLFKMAIIKYKTSIKKNHSR